MLISPVYRDISQIGASPLMLLLQLIMRFLCYPSMWGNQKNTMHRRTIPLPRGAITRTFDTGPAPSIHCLSGVPLPSRGLLWPSHAHARRNPHGDTKRCYLRAGNAARICDAACPPPHVTGPIAAKPSRSQPPKACLQARQALHDLGRQRADCCLGHRASIHHLCDLPNRLASRTTAIP